MTGKHQLTGMLNGLHGEVASTQMTISGSNIYAEALPPTPLARRKTIYIHNNGPQDSDILYIGASGIAANPTVLGLPIANGAGIGLDVSRSTLWAKATSSGVDIRVLEIA